MTREEFKPHRFQVGSYYPGRVSVRFNEAYWRPDTILVVDMYADEDRVEEVKLAPPENVTKEAKNKARGDFFKLLMSFNEWRLGK